MRNIILFLLLIFLVGCSEKSVNIYAVVKPNDLNKVQIRDIKIDKIQNDKVNLKERIIQKMEEINGIVSNYFNIDQNSNTILNGEERFIINDNFYSKKVKIYYDKPRCKVFLYPCKNINNMLFCKRTPKIYGIKDFNNLEKQSYQNKNYILLKNEIYKKNVKCKPEFETIKCEKKEILLNATLNIIKNKISIFSKTYTKSLIDDPCKDIDEIYPNSEKIYKSDIDFRVETDRLANLIANEFVADIAPHYSMFNIEIIDDLDVKLSNKDKKEFENIISKIDNNKNDIFSLISKMEKLSNKYPKSCIIKYDLAVMYMKIKEFKKAKNLIYSFNCNKDIEDKKNNLLKILNRIYSYK